jgi:tetratricopeptide (TPR) repeat protein
VNVPLPDRIEARKALATSIKRLPLPLDPENPPQVPERLIPMMSCLRQLMDADDAFGTEQLIKFGNIEVGEGETDRAVFCYKRAATRAEEGADDHLAGIALSNMGMVLVGKRQFNLALRMLQQAVSHSARAEDHSVHGQALYSMGVVFKQLEQPMMSRQSFEQALEVAEKDHHLDLVARCLQNLAYFECAEKELARAVEYLRRALDVYAQTGNTMDQLRAYYNIGLVYADQNDFTSAIRHLERAREIRNLREVEYEGDRIEQAIELVRQRQRDLGPHA